MDFPNNRFEFGKLNPIIKSTLSKPMIQNATQEYFIFYPPDPLLISTFKKN